MGLRNIQAYRDFKRMRKEVYDVVIRMPKCAKHPLGTSIVDELFVTVRYLATMAAYTDPAAKLQYLNAVLFEIDVLRDQIEFCYEEGYVCMKQATSIYLAMESIEKQLGAFRKALLAASQNPKGQGPQERAGII